LSTVGLFTARYYRNLPNERREAARLALSVLGFRVTDEHETNFRVAWDGNDRTQGPMPDDTWRRAAAPLRDLDLYGGIEEIDLFSTGVVDLHSLVGLTTVRTLKVIDSQADDLTPIAGMTQLGALYLTGAPRIDDDDFRVLRNFGDLNTLYLGGSPGLTGRVARELLGLPIRELALNNCPKVDNVGVAALAGLPLEMLTIDRTGARVDGALVDLILSFPNLKAVSLLHVPSDPEAFRHLLERADARGLVVSPRPGPVVRLPVGESAPPRTQAGPATEPSPTPGREAETRPVSPTPIPPKEPVHHDP
jgi:hypothetical protein